MMFSGIMSHIATLPSYHHVIMARCFGDRGYCSGNNKQFLQWILLSSMFTFFDMMASNMILTQLILALICPSHLDHESSWVPQLLPECNDTSKSFISKGTDWLDIIARDNSIAALATTFTLTILGDVVGRKPIALLAAGALCLDKLFMALSPRPSVIHYAHVACGLFGSMNLYFAFMYSAMADISGLSRRSKDFAWVEAALYLGVSIGPYMGGLLAEKFGIQMPFYVSSVGFLITFVYILMIQETLPKDQRTQLLCRSKTCQSNNSRIEQNGEDPLLLDQNHSVNEACPASDSDPSTTEPIPKETKWWMITPVGVLIIFTQSWNWIVLLSLFFFTMFEQGGYVFIISLYAKYKFDWGAYQIGLWTTVLSIGFSIVLGPVSRALPLNDQSRVVLSCTWGLIMTSAVAYCTKGWMLLMIAGFGCVTSLDLPSLRGTASKLTQRDKQGSILGAIGTMQAAMGSLVPAVVGPLFQYLLDINYPNYIFPVLGGSLGIAGIIASCLYPKQPHEET